VKEDAMHYEALVVKEGRSWLISFPDCPGCQTFAERENDVVRSAQEALEGWLEANLAERRLPPRPKARRRTSSRSSVVAVSIAPVLSLALEVRWARDDQSLSQADLAARVGVSQQQIAKIEDPDANPTLATIARVLDALGLELELRVQKREDQRPPERARKAARRKTTRRAKHLPRARALAH
jgi:transcriptional regulator with XRE-family HTH domain/predicted RNase H-like HicB family nuclease